MNSESMDGGKKTTQRWERCFPEALFGLTLILFWSLHPGSYFIVKATGHEPPPSLQPVRLPSGDEFIGRFNLPVDTGECNNNLYVRGWVDLASNAHRIRRIAVALDGHFLAFAPETFVSAEHGNQETLIFQGFVPLGCPDPGMHRLSASFVTDEPAAQPFAQQPILIVP